MSDNVKDIDIVGVASGLLTRIFKYPTGKLKKLEKEFNIERNSFSWLSSLPPFGHEEVRGICFSTVEESLIIAAHFSTRRQTNVLFAKCGEDSTGEEFSGLMKNYGIRYETIPTSKRPTFTTHIYVSPEDREPTIISLTGGASNLLTVGDIKEEIIKRSQFLMADAYNVSLPSLHEVIVYASQMAHKHNTKIVYGLGRHEVVRNSRDKLEQYIDTCRPEILNGNQFEFKELLFRDSYKQITDKELGIAVQEYIRSRKIETAVATFSERGSYVIRHDELIRIEPHKVLESKIRDKACAGTAYMGGFLEALCQGKDYEEAGRWGSYAASQTLQQYGLKPNWKIPPTFFN